MLFLCRDAAVNHDSIEERAQRSDDVNTSSNLGKLQDEMMTTDSAAAAADLDSEQIENESITSAVDHSLHDHQYYCKFNGRFTQVHGRRRKRPHLTGSDHLLISDHSRMDAEFAENNGDVGSEHDTTIAELEMKNKDKAICEVCGWVSSTSESLEAHMRIHDGKKTVKCNVSVPVDTKADTHTCELCGKVFYVRQEFCKHLTEVHKSSDDDHSRLVTDKNTALEKNCSVEQKENEPYKGDMSAVCDICGWNCKKPKSSGAFRKHMIFKHTTERPFKCGQCSLTFKSKANLHRHGNLHANVRRFLCQYCAESFQQKASLMSHMYKHHADKMDSDPSSRPFSCRFCSKTFYRCSEVQRHVRAQHQSAFCERCGRIFYCNAELQKHVCGGTIAAHGRPVGANRRDPTRAFGCNICDMSFCFAVRLEEHMTTIHGSDTMGSIYKCCLCNEQFELMTALESHASKEHNVCTGTTPIDSKAVGAKRHSPSRAFGCNICDVSFCFAVRLEQHMTVVHGTENMGSIYKCCLCSEQFELMIALESHASKKHNVVRPQYQCTECERLFTLEYKLKQHMRIHTVNAITCSVCHKKFHQNCHLKVHMMTHASERQTTVRAKKVFECSVCGKRCASKPDLREHERIHTGEKPYVCNICGKAFRQHTALVQHRRIHTNVKSFCCSLCSKAYRNRIDLRLHSTRVHNVELPTRSKAI